MHNGKYQCRMASYTHHLIIMEISKAPTLWLKAPNKHGITHIMYTEVEMLSAIKMYVRKKKRKKANT